MVTMADQNLGKTLARPKETRIHLCGRFTARIGGRRVEDELPGRQGRMLFAFLAAHRLRPTPRGELLQILWPDSPPAAADSALAALLAKLRRAVGPNSLAGKHDICLTLPSDSWVDIEAAADGLHRAQSAVALQDWTRAWGPARVALHIASRPLLPGYDSPWIAEYRRKLEDLLICSHECVSAVGLALGGPELASAERAAKSLIELAPYRESGYRLLMQVLAARDNVAEALTIYEGLRKLLKQELGASPGAATQALHRQLLQGRGAPRPATG